MPSVSIADWPHLSRRLDEALDLAPAARAAWLADLQLSEPEAAHTLGRLLAAHGQPAGSLDAAPTGLLVDALSSQAAGRMVGLYRLIEPLGEGGMATVWLAEQTANVLRRVALKLPHRSLGMGQRTMERFTQERDLLASLEHPHIARLYDAGVAADGQPYLAMEWVQGQPITQYCEAQRLDIAARLRLFQQVLRAVGHAHAALVIHRDLKPSNILVTADGQVKLLDFGIAALLQAPGDTPSADEALMFTPDAASPEQRAGRSLSTASDVYSLGVVLYELLTGQRPYHLTDLTAELLQGAQVSIIPPSHAAPAGLRARLAGDLDAIVMACLRSEPGERYASVEALGKDLARHLVHAPVAVRGRSGRYLLGRFLRRYRWWVGGGGLVFGALGLALGLSLWQMQRAELARDVAERAAAREEALRYYLIGMFRSSIAEQGGASASPTAKAMLDRSAQRVLEEYRDDPQRAGKVAITLADLYGALEDVEGQVPLLEGFLAAATPQADPESVALARQKLANIELLRGHAGRAATLLAQAEAFWAQEPTRHREQQLEAMLVRGTLQRSQGDLAGSLATYRAAIREREAGAAAPHRETALLYNSLAITLTAANQLDEALSAYRRTLAIFARLGRSEDLDALVIRANTGTLAYRLGHLAEAEQVLMNAFEAQRRRAGDSAAVAAAMGLYGMTQAVRERFDVALPLLREALAMAERFAGPASPLAVRGRVFLAEAQLGAGDLAGAAISLAEAQARAGERLGADHLLTQRVRLNQARLAARRGEQAAAERQFAALLPRLQQLGAPARTALADAFFGLGQALLAQGRTGLALPPLREALALREALLWPEAWELAQARVALGAALQGPERAALLSQGSAALAAQLGPTHRLSVQAQALLRR